jgi:hypothetical protein
LALQGVDLPCPLQKLQFTVPKCLFFRVKVDSIDDGRTGAVLVRPAYR